jgi:hypothetical protein
MRFRHYLAILASVFLVACEQAQMHGPVGGGSVTVAELRSGIIVVSNQVTMDEATADAALAGYSDGSDFIKRTVLGIVLLDNFEFRADTWYLMTVAGGFDYGVDGPLVPTSVAGSVHALIEGSRLTESNITLSPLTEAAYQFVAAHLDTLSDAQLQAALDDLAPELVGDVDENSTVEYADVLAWNRLIPSNVTLLKAAATPLEELTQSMADGDSEEQVRAHASALFEASAPAGVAEAFFAASVNEPVSQSICRSCHSTSGIAKGTRHIVTSGSSAAAIDANVAMYRNLVAALGVTNILNKASGQVSHTGGMRLTPGTTKFEDFEAFLELL